MTSLPTLLRRSAASAPAVVTFPDDYPNSVKHFLLIGCFGYLILAITALYFTLTRPK